ncbi:hypothetical protein [Halosolutus gelatinilyticus]|uniref:hypothetical protein n=1 Tax=Halosolutus gelatinilyticus TaxID=2931975 RepID=UPI003CE51630
MGSASTPTDRGPVTEVACPQCDTRVEISVPDREVDPVVRPYVAAFGDHSVVHCSDGHKFWVYYC